MCGILVDLSGENTSKFDVALSTMMHRGPDASGLDVVFGASLGHRRLSIIDLGNQSDQPFKSDDGNLMLVYNGEIYNYKELTKKYGLECKTGSDTEVLLKLYERFGVACLDELNGMFAFVILHKDSGKIFAARDRLGIKPLYIDRRCDALVFSSEIRALLEINGDIDWDIEGLRAVYKATGLHGKAYYL